MSLHLLSNGNGKIVPVGMTARVKYAIDEN